MGKIEGQDGMAGPPPGGPEPLPARDMRLHLLFDHAPFGIFHFDPDGVIQDANEAFAVLLGTPREALPGFDMPARVAHPGVLGAVRDALAGRPGAYEGEYVSVTGGRRVHIRLTTHRVTDESGQSLGGLGLVEDLTNRREAEASYRGLFEEVQEAIYVLDREGRFLDVNPGALAMYGCERGHLVGHTPEATAAPGRNDLEAVGRMLARAFEGEPQRFDFWGQRANGEIFPKEVRLYRGRHFGQDVVVALGQDISERVAAEAALRDREAQLRAMFEHTTDAVFWVRVQEDGTFLLEDINPAQEATLGLARSVVAGRPFHAFLPAHVADAVTANYRRFLAAGAPLHYEETTGLEGDERTFQTLLIPIRDGEGRIFRIVGSSRDITAKRKADEDLRQAQKLESLGVLAGGLAHDFNNLLTALLGNLDLAQARAAEGKDPGPLLEKTRGVALKAADLTQQMLAYSGRGRFTVTRLDLDEAVREIHSLLQVSVPKKATLRLDLAGDLPTVEGDRAQLHQVILNLVTNASEALGDGGGVVRLATSARVLDEAEARGFQCGPGPYVVLTVSDDGCGMTADVRRRIFDPFYTTKRSGRGLGLSALLGILRGHGGGVQVESEPGKGTTFTVLLPALGLPVPAPPAPAPEPPAPPSARTVLLVDDEPDLRDTVGALLEALGWKVLTAGDGQEAVDLCGTGAPMDLVVMDLTMPRMDGREAFLEMRDLRPDLPVVLCSGYSEQESLQAFGQGGPAAFLQKPFTFASLRAVLDRVAPSGP